jgi:hypothetical protein
MALNRFKLLLTVLAVATFAATASAISYVEVLSAAQTTGGNADLTTTRMAVIEGTTSYHFLADNVTPKDLAMNKVTGVGTSPSTATITDLASWTADVGAPASDRVFTGYGMAIVGDFIQIMDGSNDEVYRLNKNTGTVSRYVDNATISTAIGGGSPSVSNWNGVALNGEAVFYESTSDSILQTTGAGSIATLVTSAELGAAQGGDTTVDSGLTYDPLGNLYWGENTTDKIYRRDAGGTISAIIDSTALTPLIGSSISFSGDMYYAPDGWIYMRAGGSGFRSILRFDPGDVDPASTLETYLSESDLVNGPAGSAFVLGFSWYDGNLAWTTSNPAYYAVPEPGTLVLMALAGLAVVRRRR